MGGGVVVKLVFVVWSGLLGYVGHIHNLRPVTPPIAASPSCEPTPEVEREALLYLESSQFEYQNRKLRRQLNSAVCEHDEDQPDYFHCNSEYAC